MRARLGGFVAGWITSLDRAVNPVPGRTYEDGVKAGMSRGFAVGFDLAHEDPECRCRQRAPFTR